MKSSIVIPNYNGKELLEKNLPAVISAFENKKNNIIEVIIVDDGSSDDSVNFINQKYKGVVKLIKHTKNRGFATSVNTGVRATKGDLIVLLNSDVSPSTNFLEKIDEPFEDKSVFAVSLHEKGYGGAKGNFIDGFVEIGMKKESTKIEKSFYVSGGSGVFRKSIWQDLSGMDERLLSPFYWEDIDLCYRAIKRGYSCLWSPDSDVVHNHESTISKLPKKYVARIRERNQLLLIWKNITSRSMFLKHINFMLKRAFAHPGYFIIIFMALGKISEVLRLRKREVKESKVSDEAVFSIYSA